jgi:hypothetical protein
VKRALQRVRCLVGRHLYLVGSPACLACGEKRPGPPQTLTRKEREFRCRA